MRELPTDIVGDMPWEVNDLGRDVKGRIHQPGSVGLTAEITFPEKSGLFSPQLQYVNTGCGFMKAVRRPSCGSQWVGEVMGSRLDVLISGDLETHDR